MRNLKIADIFNVRDKIDFPWITVDGDLKVEGLLIDSTVLLYPPLICT